MIYITGDTHGDFSRFSSKKFKKGRELTKKDYVIILGDFAGLWDRSDSDKYWLDWLNNKPWTTLFVDGNHENFEMLHDCPTVQKFGKGVGQCHSSIFWLRRGEVYEIDGKSFFTFGGGNSFDKENRKINITWWPQEMPSYAEYQYGLETIEKEKEVDYVLTHTCPGFIFKGLEKLYDMGYKDGGEDQLREFLEMVSWRLDFKYWYFGHFHHDVKLSQKYTCLYEGILKV